MVSYPHSNIPLFRLTQGHGSGPGPGGFLYTWDGGNQLTYPVKYHDIGYKEPPPMVMQYNPTSTIIQYCLLLYDDDPLGDGPAGDRSLH